MKLEATRYEHGTRARYVAGCRCAPCTASNTAYYHARRARARELAGDVKPSGPPLDGTLERAGKTYRVKRCPGANGAACVCLGGPAWLRVGEVCALCVEHATIWNGLVPGDRAWAHIHKLARAGVGKHAVAAAADVSHTRIQEIKNSGGWIRISAQLERRILAIDSDAIADGQLVDGARSNEIVGTLRNRGFTHDQIAELLDTSTTMQHPARDAVRASTQAKLERVLRRVERGEITPRRFLTPARVEKWTLRQVLNAGVPRAWLQERLGFGDPEEPRMVGAPHDAPGERRGDSARRRGPRRPHSAQGPSARVAADGRATRRGPRGAAHEAARSRLRAHLHAP